MVVNIKTGKARYNQCGFTIMELLVVLLLVSLLASIVTPVVSNSIERAKESTLKENLFVMRKAIDDYYADKGYYPEQLDLLVAERYLRFIPEDPLTENTQWQEQYTAQDEYPDGIVDIHSLSNKQAKDGSYYNEW